MLVVIVLLVCWLLSALGTYALQRHAPSNRAIRYLRTLSPARAIPTSVGLAGGYLLAAFACTMLIDQGGPGWLNVLVAILGWNGLKLTVVSVLRVALLAGQILQRHLTSPTAELAHVIGLAGYCRSCRTGRLSLLDCRPGGHKCNLRSSSRG